MRFTITGDSVPVFLSECSANVCSECHAGSLVFNSSTRLYEWERCQYRQRLENIHDIKILNDLKTVRS